MAADEMGEVVRTAPERVLRSGLLALSHRRTLGRVATATPVTRPLVHRFVAGESFDEALPRLLRLKAEGLHSTADVLGEAVTSPDEAIAAADRYVETLGRIAAEGLDRNVSLKLSQLGLAIDRDLAASNLERIVARADELGGFVRIDMEDSPTVDATLAIHRQVWAAHRNVGVVMQASLHRTAEDIRALNADGVRIRLCKGAYRERAAIAWTIRSDIDRSFADLAGVLLREGTYPAFATHDERLVRHVLREAREAKVTPDRFEFQMLYGIRRDLQERLVAAGYTVRIYVPFGQQWYPYFMRRLAERPANLLFLLPTSVLGRRAHR